MVGSSQHALAKYLAAVIDSVLQLYSNNCIKDSFTIAKEMQDFQMHPKETFFCSFDICSLFTNVALAETNSNLCRRCMAVSSLLQTTPKKSSWN